MVSYFIWYPRIPYLNWLILLFLDILAKLLPLCIIYYLWVTLLRCNTVWKCLPYFSTVGEFDCKEVHMIHLFLSLILSSKLCSIQFKGRKEDDSTLSFYPSWNKGKCLCSWYFCLSFGLLYIWIRLLISICLSLYHLSTWTFASFLKCTCHMYTKLASNLLCLFLSFWSSSLNLPSAGLYSAGLYSTG